MVKLGQPTVVPVPGDGPEDVVVDADGQVYTGTSDGAVFKVRPDGSRIDLVGDTGGRPLGLELLADGRVLVCDAHRGLLALDPGGGRIEELVTTVHGQRMRFCNNAAVAGTGETYFSDSSRLHGIDRWRAEMVEDTRSGRLLRRSADGRETEVLLDGLRFANGVVLAADESYVAVAETAGRRIVRRWLTGPSAGRVDHLAVDLPGYPDNLSRGSDGLLWVALASPTDPVLERLMAGPHVLRRAAWRLPVRLQPRVKRTVRVLALDDAGAVVHDLSLDPSSFHMVTGVGERDGVVWLSSLQGSAVAWFSL